MSVAVNRSLHPLPPKPKRRKNDSEIKPSPSPNCCHWFVSYGICISCNSPVDKSKGLSFDYIDKGIQMSYDAYTLTKLAISQVSWIEDKKLHLVLDLDNTLIHTIKISQLSKSDKYLTEEAESRNDLWRFNTVFSNETLIKLRPFVHEFLKHANEMFSMYVYTKGGYEYAQIVLDLIDPGRIYFADRVITRKHSPGLKTLDLVLADERGIVIVDDRRSVWPDHQKNLLQIAKYEYFRNKDDQEPLRTFFSSESKKKRDESDEEGPLASVLKFLKDVHKRFFNGRSEKELDSMDVRPLLKVPSSRSKRKAVVKI